MKVIRKGIGVKGIKGGVVTLGNFDGIHAGHQSILRRVVKRARSLGRPSVVYTFDPHPLKVVAPHKSPQLILDMKDKESVIRGLGVDFLVFARFTRAFASKHPAEFVEEVLVKGLKAKEVWVGADFSFGKGRTGTLEYLKSMGKEFGFKAFGMGPYKKGGAVVSSSRVRGLIKSGEVKKAGVLLGRPYTVKGRVVKGRGIGRGLGFPTANVGVTSEIIPLGGVYAGHAVIKDKRYPAVVNIGIAPTFGRRRLSVEAHILGGFKENIYGKEIRVEFSRRLRSERKFRDKDALARQILRDMEAAGKA